MTTLDATERRRALDAIGLGPVWVRRGLKVAVEAESFELRAQRIASMDAGALRSSVANCVACDLSRTRTRTVFGDGAARAGWFVVGEAPGADDDATGDAFGGPAGRLLDAMLASVGRSRSGGAAPSAFVTHVVKCRPPADRAPSTAEVACCRPYLQRQIALHAPRLLLAVGDLACAALLGPQTRVAALRGRAHAVSLAGHAYPVVVTHGPSQLAAGGASKAEAWADLCLARSVDDEVA